MGAAIGGAILGLVVMFVVMLLVGAAILCLSTIIYNAIAGGPSSEMR